MLVAQRVRGFRRVVTLLQRYKDVGEAHIRKMEKKGLSSASMNAKNEATSLPTSSSPASSSTSSSSSSLQTSVLIDKLLFREVPISLSLVERAWTKENKKQKKKKTRGASTPTVTPPVWWCGQTHDTPLTFPHAVPHTPPLDVMARTSSHVTRQESGVVDGETKGSASLSTFSSPSWTVRSPVGSPVLPVEEVSGEAPGDADPSTSFAPTPPLSRFSPSLLVDLLEGLHEAESERRWHVQEKTADMEALAHHHAHTLRQMQCRLRVLSQKQQKCAHKWQKVKESSIRRRWDGFEGGKKETRTLLPSLSKARPHEAVHGGEKDVEEEHAALTHAIHTLEQRRQEVLARQRENTQDALLLQRQSLLTRPYLTATLWRLLLRQEVWVAAMHYRAPSSSTPGSISSPSPPSFPSSLGSLSSSRLGLSDSQLLRVLWCWSRVVVGVLRDVVEGCQPLPSSSPRFAVSLPSRAYRRRRREAVLPRAHRRDREGAEDVTSSAIHGPSTKRVCQAGGPPQGPPSHVSPKGNSSSPAPRHSSSSAREEEEAAAAACMDDMMQMMLGTVETTTGKEEEGRGKAEEQAGQEMARGSSPIERSFAQDSPPSTPVVETVTVMEEGKTQTPWMPRRGTRRKKRDRHRISPSSSSSLPSSPSTEKTTTLVPSSLVTASTSSSSITLRWLPRPSLQLLPLLVETLALWRHLLGALPVEKILQCGGAAGHASSASASSSSALMTLTSLLVAVKEVATTTLLLWSDGTAASRAASPSAAPCERTTFHTVLHALEEVVLHKVRDVRQQLHSPSSIRRLLSHAGDTTTTTMPTGMTPVGGNVMAAPSTLPPILQGVSPVQAAHLLLDLQHLHALSPTSPAAQCIVQQCCLLLFPQLRTHTWEVWMARARQTSLLAFISRSQHAQLHRRGIHVESVLKNARQRSRLEQRRQAAALRGIHVSEMQRQTLVSLAESLQPAELVEVLQLLAAHLVIRDDDDLQDDGDLERTGPQGGKHARRREKKRRGERSRQWGGSPASTSTNGTSCATAGRTSVLMSTLLVAEAVLVGNLLHPPDPLASLSTLSSVTSPSSLPLCHLADLWVVIAVLKPVVDASKAALPSSCSSLSTSVSSSRSPLFQVLATQVVQALQGSLTTFVLGSSSSSSEEEDDDDDEGEVASERPRRLPSSSSDVRLPSDLAVSLHKIIAGILRWEDESSGRAGTEMYGRTSPTNLFSHQPLHREVQDLTVIMKEVFLMHSLALHEELRRRFPDRSKAKTPTGKARSSGGGGRGGEEEKHWNGGDSMRRADGGEEVGVERNNEVEGFKKNVLQCFQRMSLLDSAVERTVASF